MRFFLSSAFLMLLFYSEPSLVSAPLRQFPVFAAKALAAPSAQTNRALKSQNGHFLVSYVASPDPVPLKKDHSWTLEIKKGDGSPTNRAEITSFEATMPEHKHGLAKAVQIKRPTGPGIIRVANVHFTMPGLWVITVKIRADKIEDTVVFNLNL